MGFRFRRTIKVFPGVRLNISRSGISTTVGVRGATLTTGLRGTAVNVGIPGSGLSYRQRVDKNTASQSSRVPVPSAPSPPLAPEQPSLAPDSPIAQPGEIRSVSNEALTSLSLKELRDLLAEAYSELQRLRSELPAADTEFSRARRLAASWDNGFFLKHIMKKRHQAILADYRSTSAEREELIAEIEKCRVSLDVEMEAGINTTYNSFADSFRALSACARCWDTVSSVAVNQVKERSKASESITRTPITLDMSATDVIAPSTQAMHFQNANGADIFILPGLMLMYSSQSDFALIRLAEVNCDYSQCNFIETETIPTDAKVVSETWAKVNKDGSPDRRFSGNYKIPVVQYGGLSFRTSTGLNERFLFSSASAAEAYAKAFSAHKAALPPL